MEKLEKIDLIRERLGVSYEEAYNALDDAEGDVVEAIVNLERKAKQEFGKDRVNVKSKELIEKLKKLIKEGNVNKIVVKNDEKTLAEIPVNAGVASLVLAPYLTLLAGAAAVYKDYTLEIDRDNGNEEINFKEDGQYN